MLYPVLVQGLEHAVHIQIANSYNGKKHNKQNIKVREESDLIHISNIKISVKIILFDCNWNKCIKKLLKKQGSSSNFNMLIVNYF